MSFISHLGREPSRSHNLWNTEQIHTSSQQFQTLWQTGALQPMYSRDISKLLRSRKSWFTGKNVIMMIMKVVFILSSFIETQHRYPQDFKQKISIRISHVITYLILIVKVHSNHEYYGNERPDGNTTVGYNWKRWLIINTFSVPLQSKKILRYLVQH